MTDLEVSTEQDTAEPATRWHTRALRDHVDALLRAAEDGPTKTPIDQSMLRTIRSVGRAIDIFHHHAYAARDALKGILDENTSDQQTVLLLLGSGDRYPQYHRASIASEAHLLGALQTARALYDVFSHVINGLLIRPQMSIERCDIHRAQDALPEGPLRTKLGELLTSDWFQYVQGFTNTAKHRELVTHGLSLDFVEKTGGIRIGAFEYRGKHFPQYWIEDVLKGAFKVKNKIVDCGRALNVACGVEP